MLEVPPKECQEMMAKGTEKTPTLANVYLPDQEETKSGYPCARQTPYRTTTKRVPDANSNPYIQKIVTAPNRRRRVLKTDLIVC